MYARLGLIALATLYFASDANAESPDETRLRPRWQALDINHDGKVTIDEQATRQAEGLKRMDQNGDGEISLAEFTDFDLDPSGVGRKPLAPNVLAITDVPYAGTIDPRQTVEILLPKEQTVPGPLPVLAYVHGGGWSTGSKVMARSQVMKLVDSGRYAAVSIGYRLSWQSRWPAQLHDVKAGIRWIRANANKYNFDRNRVCALGPSAGGHLVAKLGLTNGDAAAEGTVGPNLSQSSRVQCVVDMFGPVDLLSPPPVGQSRSVENLIGGKIADMPELARSVSAVADVDKGDPPFFILHGTMDATVNYQNSVNLEAALRAAGVPVLFQTVAGGGHGTFGNALPAVEERIRLFLERMFYDPSTQVPTDTLKK